MKKELPDNIFEEICETFYSNKRDFSCGSITDIEYEYIFHRKMLTK